MPASAAPHSPQNFCPGGFVLWQAGQEAVSGAPQFPQNFCPGGFECWQRAHAITGPSSCGQA